MNDQSFTPSLSLEPVDLNETNESTPQNYVTMEQMPANQTVLPMQQPMGQMQMQQPMEQMQQPMNPMQQAMNPMQQAMNPMQQAMNPMQQAMNPMQQPMGQMQQAMNPMQQAMNQMQQPMNQMQQPMNQMQQPMNQMQQPMNQMQQPMNQMQQPMNQMQQPMNQMQQPMNQMQQPMGQMQQSMGQMQQPMGQMQQPMGQMQQPMNQMTMTPNVSTTEISPLSLEEQQAMMLEAQILTQEQLRMVDEFSKKIDVKDSAAILQYGAAAQKDVASFSEKTLADVRTKDLGAIGDTLTSLVKELKGFGSEEEEEKGLKGFFKKKKDSLESLRSSYTTVENNVDRISKSLESHQVVLMKDIAMFDELYQKNQEYYQQLTMYILAGKKRLQELRATDLVQLEQKAQMSGLPQDAQEYNDFANHLTRFEKKLHDLDLTRMVSIQMGPQTRLLQNNNVQMVEKLQTSLVNTIPLWKSQMVLAMGLEHAKQAAEAQRAVTDLTNEMLKKNADMLKMNTVNTAREMERAVVDIETIRHTNQQLISSIDEVMVIQREGAQKRKEAEVELVKIEGELRNKLLEIRDVNQTLPNNPQNMQQTFPTN